MISTFDIAQITAAFSAHASDYVAMFLHFLSLSLLSVGGAIMLAPAMQHYFVVETVWLSDAEFSASIAISQSAPGPNILFVSLMGWNVGVGWATTQIAAAGGASPLMTAALMGSLGMTGAIIGLLGIMLPSSTLTYFVARWAADNSQRLIVRAFKQGMTPVVIALLAATGWVISASSHLPNQPHLDWHIWLITGVTALLAWRTQLHLLWLLGLGALAGVLGFV